MFMETSAKSALNVNDLFMAIGQQRKRERERERQDNLPYYILPTPSLACPSNSLANRGMAFNH